MDSIRCGPLNKCHMAIFRRQFKTFVDYVSAANCTIDVEHFTCTLAHTVFASIHASVECVYV